jgi:putative hydrolase of the HAD superfamily
MNHPNGHGPTTVKAVIFDWGGVIELLPDAAAFAAAETRLGLESGSLVQILWGANWEQVETGALSLEDHEAQICLRCGFADREALIAFYREFYPQRAHDAMLAAIQALRGRYQVALLTNAFPGQDRHIMRVAGVPPTELVDHYVNSAEVGMRKPQPEIFHLVLERLGVTAAEAVFIDDIRANVAAAQALGLAAIHFETPDQALAALEAHLGHPITD